MNFYLNSRFLEIIESIKLLARVQVMSPTEKFTKAKSEMPNMPKKRKSPAFKPGYNRRILADGTESVAVANTAASVKRAKIGAHKKANSAKSYDGLRGKRGCKFILDKYFDVNVANDVAQMETQEELAHTQQETKKWWNAVRVSLKQKQSVKADWTPESWAESVGWPKWRRESYYNWNEGSLDNTYAYENWLRAEYEEYFDIDDDWYNSVLKGLQLWADDLADVRNPGWRETNADVLDELYAVEQAEIAEQQVKARAAEVAAHAKKMRIQENNRRKAINNFIASKVRVK